MDENILCFIGENTNLTLCVTVNNQPHCANCFYAFCEENTTLVFKSDPQTLHIQLALKTPLLAGTILPDMLNIKALRGIQFKGYLISSEQITDVQTTSFQEIYYSKFPYAIHHHGVIWAIRLLEIKMTDNTLGFGKKLHWKRA